MSKQRQNQDQSQVKHTVQAISAISLGPSYETISAAPEGIRTECIASSSSSTSEAASAYSASSQKATGKVDKRTLERYEKEAKDLSREPWDLSWALDTSTVERAKGKAVEVGRARCETKSRRYTILDALGQKDFVPNMIDGTTQADAAVFVSSACKGEFEAGLEKKSQTREHAVLVKYGWVSQLIVAINKMDDPTVEWSKERYDEIVDKLLPFLKATRYIIQRDVMFMPVSRYRGANIKYGVDPKLCKVESGSVK
ncbi:translation termination factor GTPase eRF3 [Mortierella claussenii]|nr:translation termination factor GTPase eRF3 [Mortierella claussenii]